MESLVFYILGIIAVASAAYSVFAKKLVHSVISFAILLLCLSALLALLSVPFIALGQLIIFVGGLISLLLFGVMFSKDDTGEISQILRSPFSKIAVSVLFFLIVFLAAFSLSGDGTQTVPSFASFSLNLFRKYWEAVLLGVFALFIALVTAVFLLEEE